MIYAVFDFETHNANIGTSLSTNLLFIIQAEIIINRITLSNQPPTATDADVWPINSHGTSWLTEAK